MQSLKDILTANGVDLTGWTLTEATGVSGDGTTIVGIGTSPNGTEAFIARNTGVITTATLNNSLASMGQVSSTVSSMSQTITSSMMDASHSAQLNTSEGLSSGDEMNGRTQLWVVGTVISDSSLSGDDFGGEGGVGLTRYLANGLSVGGGAFSGKRSLDTSHGGNQKTSLIGPGVFVAYAPEAYGLRLEGGGTWHYVNMDLKRGYQNAGGSAQSSGSTQAQAFGIYGRIGWAFPVASRVALQPFAQYNWQRVKIDGYTESGGPFPARFDSRTDTSNRARLGLQAQYSYSESLNLWSWAAWSHRFENKGASMGGQLTGLYAFNYDGGPVDRNWGDAGVGAKWRPYEGFETFSRLSFGIDSQHNAEPDLALTIGLGWDI
ncbi:autotransporter outer membrane beta-barrel domain-containing protein [Pseudodesulfovibrio alkaliphilus]|nr:autotransporter outer membrane beta-barrel domain-containing protein [Pseudodesulfovibrio alkaliphilus]